MSDVLRKNIGHVVQNVGHVRMSDDFSYTLLYEFSHVTSSPHYPKSNGFIERTVQTVKSALRKAKAD